MTFQPATVSDDLMTLPKLPGWVTSGHAETLKTVAFRSGVSVAAPEIAVEILHGSVTIRLDAGTRPDRIAQIAHALSAQA